MSYSLTFPDTGAALVIGGSGGVGAAICRGLADAGSAVALTWHRGRERAEAVGRTLAERGARHAAWALDARSAEDTERVVGEVSKKFGGIHTVVCASGAQLKFRTVNELDARKWRENFDTDVHGVFNVAKASLPHLRRSTGSLVALSTMAHHRILLRDAVSACPKAAVETLVRQLACEEGQHGVRANCVALGAINAGMGSMDADSSVVADVGPEGVAAIVASIRLSGRMGSAEEAAAAVVFLASRQASYVTGQTLVVDGGWTV